MNEPQTGQGVSATKTTSLPELHSLQAPLQAVRFGLEILKMNETGNLTPDQLHIIEETLNRLATVITSARTLMAGQVSLAMEAVEPAEVSQAIDASLQALAFSMRYPELTIERDIAPELPAVQVPEAELVVVLTVILDNAAKYTPTPGTVRISACYTDGRVLVSIADTGIGVPADEVDGLFEEQRRLSNAAALDPQGNGFGLFTAREHLARFGGIISYEPNQPTGSIFTINLPVKQ